MAKTKVAIIGSGNIGPADKDVDVAELAHRNVPVRKHRDDRSLERDCFDTMRREQTRKTHQLAGKPYTAKSICVELFAYPLPRPLGLAQRA